MVGQRKAQATLHTVSQAIFDLIAKLVPLGRCVAEIFFCHLNAGSATADDSIYAGWVARHAGTHNDRNTLS